MVAKKNGSGQLSGRYRTGQVRSNQLIKLANMLQNYFFKNRWLRVLTVAYYIAFICHLRLSYTFPGNMYVLNRYANYPNGKQEA